MIALSAIDSENVDFIAYGTAISGMVADSPSMVNLILGVIYLIPDV